MNNAKAYALNDSLWMHEDVRDSARWTQAIGGDEGMQLRAGLRR